jgi:hypothetical protein
MSRSFHDPATVGQALDVAIADPSLIPRVVAATGRTLTETGCEQYAMIASQLEKWHSRGVQSVDVDLLSAELAESTCFTDRNAWKKVITEIIGTGWTRSLEEYERRLRSLRRRRAISRLAEKAENGHEDTDIERELQALASAAPGDTQIAPLEFIDFTAPAPVPPPVLVGDDSAQLVTRGELTGVVADSGAGKTKLLVGLGIGIAHGGEVLGFPCQQQPVLFVSSDIDPDIHRTVCRSWAGRGGTADGLAALPFKVHSDPDFNLDDETCFAKVRTALEAVGGRERPVVFILEVLSSNVTDPKTLVDQVLFRDYSRRRFRSLMKEFPGLSIVFSAHLRKPQQGGANGIGDRVAGSMQIRASCDCIIGLIASGKDGFEVRRVKRSRSGGDFAAFRVAIVPPGRTEPLTLRNLGAVEVTIEEARGAAGAVLTLMREKGPRMALKDIVTGVSSHRKRAVEDSCKRLAEASPPALVRVSKKPAVYELSADQGRLDMEGVE